jgi:hypothetical protein
MAGLPRNLHSTVSFIPMWHWTDQKIRVHAFCCVLSLLLLNLLRREVAQKYEKMSLQKILDTLSDVREILLLYPDKLKPIRDLSKRNNVQKRFYDILELDKFAPKLR